MFPTKRWLTAEVDAGAAASLSRALDIPIPVASVLVARGCAEPTQAAAFLRPRLSEIGDPFTLPGVEAAVERIWRAIDAGEQILVFGDYDVDGVCCTAIMVQVLRRLGGSVEGFLPHRVADGYGLGVAALASCLDTRPASLIVTVDCGTSATEAVQFAGERGAEVIVTDHHEPKATVAPAHVVVNPKVSGPESTRDLAGVGVAFKVCHGLIKRGLQQDRECAHGVDLREYLDLVAVATVADVVPLKHENRILVRHGLTQLNRRPCVGLKALMDVAKIKGEVDSFHIGFVLGPRINAAGRMGDARQALRLLMTTDRDAAAALAQELDGFNQERKRVEDGILRAARGELDAVFDPAAHLGLVVGREGWHVGMIGIVASRLTAHYGRPSAVIGIDAEGYGKGSCRSIDSVDILQVLQACEDVLVSYGGHRMAAGFAVKAEHIETLRERFNAACADQLRGQELQPVQRIDAWVELGEVDRRLLKAVNQLGPLGQGNQAPVFGVQCATLVGPARRVGATGKHLKLTVAHGAKQLEAIGFSLGEKTVPEGPLDLAFRIRENEFRGRRSIELEIKDLRPHR